MRKLLITGCAGFIGYHLTMHQLKLGHEIIGIDNLNEYYDVSLKKARLEQLLRHKNFSFYQLDIADKSALHELFVTHSFNKVVNLAAQAGVRYSITNPHAYVHSNLVGFTNLIDECRHSDIEHFVYASSSSVYGANLKQPFCESDSTEHPLAMYAATKKANEMIAHSYSHLYQLPTTGLRFFTVYGPWGRPDMALFLFTKNILLEKPIEVFNYGDMVRDFTYIDDIINGVALVLNHAPSPDPFWRGETPNPATSNAPYRIYNLGNDKPMKLMRYIEAIEAAVGKKAILHLCPMQDGDVPATHANIDAMKNELGYQPNTDIRTGVKQFVDWYTHYYKE